MASNCSFIPYDSSITLIISLTISEQFSLSSPCDFIILSGYAEFEYAQQGIQLGVMDYLLKPASVSDVKELLNKLNEEKDFQGTPESYETFQLWHPTAVSFHMTLLSH